MNIFDRIRNYFDGVLANAFENEGEPTKAEFSKRMATEESPEERVNAAHAAMRDNRCYLYLDDDGQCAVHGRDCN